MRLGEDVENLKSMIETEDRVETTVSLDSDLHDAKQVSEVDDLFAKSGMYRTRTEVGEYGVAKAEYRRVEKSSARLSYTNATVNGPGQVVQSLLKGFKKLNVEVTPTSSNFGILQPTNDLVHRKTNDIVVGPNVCVLPSEMPDVISGLKTLLVPSKWVYDKYVQDFNKILKTNPSFVAPELKIWSAGIDTEKWKPSGNPKPYHNCFIYLKRRTQEELGLIKRVFENQGMNVTVVEYGTYTPEQLYEVCENSSFCVLLDNTESQGIAVMQILSMNVPMFVLDKRLWEYNGNTAPATSVPYFDQRCGSVVSNHLSKDVVADFFLRLPTFNPRQYILEHHTLVQAAGRYMECFK